MRESRYPITSAWSPTCMSDLRLTSCVGNHSRSPRPHHPPHRTRGRRCLPRLCVPASLHAQRHGSPLPPPWRPLSPRQCKTRKQTPCALLLLPLSLPVTASARPAHRRYQHCYDEGNACRLNSRHDNEGKHDQQHVVDEVGALADDCPCNSATFYFVDRSTGASASWNNASYVPSSARQLSQTTYNSMRWSMTCPGRSAPADLSNCSTAAALNSSTAPHFTHT